MICPRCEYDLRGTMTPDGAVCPECGWRYSKRDLRALRPPLYNSGMPRTLSPHGRIPGWLLVPGFFGVGVLGAILFFLGLHKIVWVTSDGCTSPGGLRRLPPNLKTSPPGPPRHFVAPPHASPNSGAGRSMAPFRHFPSLRRFVAPCLCASVPSCLCCLIRAGHLRRFLKRPFLLACAVGHTAHSARR